MNQVLHIFRKDARRLWIEISLGIIALAVQTWFEWVMVTPRHQSRWYEDVVPVLLLVLIWWFTVVRLVHGEALVGDRQFWITRPYIWYKLLLSKVLFVVAFIAFPLSLSYIVLLIADRAPILPHARLILLATTFTMLIAVLPVAGIAVLTRKLSQSVVGAVGVILVIIALASLDSCIPNSHVPTGTESWENLQAVAFVSLTVLGIILHYAQRKRLLASVLMAASVLAVPVIMFATPYRAIIAKTFPVLTSEQIPFRIALQTDEGTRSFTPNTGEEKRVPIVFPVEVSNVPDGTLLEFNGAMLSIDTPDGQHWDSEWQPGYRDVMKANERFSLSVAIDRAVFEKVKAVPAAVRLSLAISELHDAHAQRTILNREFEVPDVGHCWIERDGSSVECRSTENAPSSMLLTVSEIESTCPPEATDHEATDKEAADKSDEGPRIMKTMSGSGTSGPFSPLTLRHFSLWQSGNKGFNQGRVCPGTPATFSTPEVARKFQLKLDLGTLRLGEYAGGSSGFTFDIK